LEQEHDADSLVMRLVVLNAEDGLAGGVRAIHTVFIFPGEARLSILEGRIPLGTILADTHVQHVRLPAGVYPDWRNRTNDF